MNTRLLSGLAVIVMALAGCDRSDSDDDDALPAELARNITIESPQPNDTDGGATTLLTASVFLPDKHRDGKSYPVIIHSHTWGGDRVSITDIENLSPGPADSGGDYFSLIDAQVRALREAGYAVISYDQRGFGRGDDGDNGSAGGSHGMSPDWEIEDAKAVLDWAVDNLNLLEDAPGDPKVGLMGNSYGGAFQPMLAAEDPRIDAIAPSATWFNLENAFAPNGVLKKAWLIALCNKVVDEDGAQLSTEMELACTQVRQETSREIEDAPITETLFFDNGVVSYTTDPSFVMPRVDALILQGVRDTLFPLNEGIDLYRFLKAAGGDVRLMAHASGHNGIRSGDGSQGPQGQGFCGDIDVITLLRRWFDEKLYNGPLVELPRICVALDNRRAVHITQFSPATTEHRVPIPSPTTVSGASENNVLSPANEALFFPLQQIDQSNLALLGIPTARLSVSAGTANSDPTPQTGPNAAGVFVGVGLLRDNQLFLVDDQVKPILSTDTRTGEAPEPIDLVGVAEKLEVGDRVGVLLYGKHDLYENHPIGSEETGSNWQGNVAIVAGSVDLPIVTLDNIVSRP